MQLDCSVKDTRNSKVIILNVNIYDFSTPYVGKFGGSIAEFIPA
ncbi:hypothetical protein FORC065_1631 [Yersinia enterocolitica]|nr:hypothetical protein FORC065_1631 [Yersinia enterocolitica]